MTQILDTTIRDGSYAVNFKFDCEDVKDVVRKSQKIGLEYIEIGHGQGLNASGPVHGYALNTDLEYLQAARQAAPQAKIGFFCIPGIAELEHITRARENGMDFVRIGVNVADLPKAEKYLSHAKSLGVETFINFMKSYAVSPEELAQAAKTAGQWGADGVYIVDSAGCMMPDELGRYIDAIRECTNVKIGFHGHNNLGMAVANTVYCVEKGIEFVDCSYQGLGRSCGNASIEQTVMVLQRKGYCEEFDLPRVLEYGYSALRNIVDPAKLVNPLDYVCGYCGFHSSFIKDIYRCCREMQVDPLRLILKYTQEDRVGMDYDRLVKAAGTLPKDLEKNPYRFGKIIDDYNR